LPLNCCRLSTQRTFCTGGRGRGGKKAAGVGGGGENEGEKTTYTHTHTQDDRLETWQKHVLAGNIYRIKIIVFWI